MQQQQQQQQPGYSYPPQIVTHPPSEDELVEKSGPTAMPPHGAEPSDPPFVAQRKSIEQRLGPNCSCGGYHELRMHWTNDTLCCAFFLLPALCGYRGKREYHHQMQCVCTKCDTKFPEIILPEP